MRDERDEFEQGLNEELRRVAAPDGFADRVMVRARKGERAGLRIIPQRMLHVWQAVAAVALIVVLFGVAETTHRRLERRQAGIVQRQFDIAMQITGKTLSGVSERVSQAGTKQDRGKQ